MLEGSLISKVTLTLVPKLDGKTKGKLKLMSTQPKPKRSRTYTCNSASILYALECACARE